MRDQAAEIFQGLSPEARTLLVDVLQLERESLHLKAPQGLKDAIVKKLEGIVK